MVHAHVPGEWIGKLSTFSIFIGRLKAFSACLTSFFNNNKLGFDSAVSVFNSFGSILELTFSTAL